MTTDNGKSKEDYKYFAARLVDNEYVLTERDYISTNIIFSSEWINPQLDKVENFYFKLNYLCNILSNELAKKGYKITPSKIKDRVLIKEVSVYHARELDEESNRDADFLYIIDMRIYRTFVYKRFTELDVNGISAVSDLSKTKNVFKCDEISADDFFSSAASFAGEHLFAYDLKTETELLNEFAENKVKLVLFVNEDMQIDYLQDKCEIDIDTKKVNYYEFKIISTQKPLIQSQITIKLVSGNKTLYSATGEIISQRTVTHKEYYAHNILIKFDTAKKLEGAKALLAYTKNLKSKIKKK